MTIAVMGRDEMDNDLISKLSEIRSEYNCFDENEEPYYRALSEAIKFLSQRADGDTVSRQAAKDALAKFVPYAICDESTESYTNGLTDAYNLICQLPSAQPEWNNHTVACLLAELFDDTCACNYNGIDEWLPIKCELLESCPNPVGVACWEQYLKHRAERRTDEGFD